MAWDIQITPNAMLCSTAVNSSAHRYCVHNKLKITYPYKFEDSCCSSKTTVNFFGFLHSYSAEGSEKCAI